MNIDRLKPDGRSSDGPYKQITVSYDHEQAVTWCYMRPTARPCFTPDLLAEIRTFQCALTQQIKEELNQKTSYRWHYSVLASHIPGVFNLGGDLALFRELIGGGEQVF